MLTCNEKITEHILVTYAASNYNRSNSNSSDAIRSNLI